MMQANNCEVVVTFEAVNEFGDSFMCRQSYLANEIHWGHVFTCIIQQADSGLTQHTADLSRFHDVEPQPNLPVLPPGPLSMSILASGTMSRMLPYPLLGDNTLVISQFCTITYRGGTPCLMFRVGDTRPCQMLEVHVRMYLYDWTPTTTPEGEFLPYTVQVSSIMYTHCSSCRIVQLILVPMRYHVQHVYVIHLYKRIPEPGTYNHSVFRQNPSRPP